VLVTNHVLSGVLIGAVIKRPLPAFAVGVASHFVLDSLPHWGERGMDQRRFLRIARTDGLTGLAAMATFAVVAPPERRLAVLASMAGAALPDLDKPARLWFGRSPWPGAVNRFHSRIQNEAPERFRRELTTMGLLAVAGLLAMRASQRKPAHANAT